MAVTAEEDDEIRDVAVALWPKLLPILYFSRTNKDNKFVIFLREIDVCKRMKRGTDEEELNPQQENEISPPTSYIRHWLLVLHVE